MNTSLLVTDILAPMVQSLEALLRNIIDQGELGQHFSMKEYDFYMAVLTLRKHYMEQELAQLRARHHAQATPKEETL